MYCKKIHETKCGAGRICGTDLNGDNLRIYKAYQRISDHCRVTFRVRVRDMVRVRVRVRNMVRVRVSIRVSVRVGVADCCIQTARKSDKMRINHVIKTRSVTQIRPAAHFVVPRSNILFTSDDNNHFLVRIY